MQDVAGISEAALQQLLAPTHVLKWTAPPQVTKGQGVAFAVSSNIAGLCSIKRAAEHGGLTWMECSGRLFSHSGKVHIANVYIPPVGSNHSRGEYEQRLEELMQDTTVYSAAGPHIWMGDFNADVWGGSELPDGGNEIMNVMVHATELHTPRTVRGEAPNRLKQQALAFLEAASATGSVLLTGRKGDAGAATFHSATGRGSSRVDHIVAHYSLWQAFTASSVPNTTEVLSDHRPVQARVRPPDDHAIDVGARRTAAQPQGASHLAWRQDRAQQYGAALAGNTAGFSQLDQAIAAGDDEAAMAALVAVVQAAASSCGMICTPRLQGQGNHRVKRPAWWGEEVQAAYTALKRASLDAAPGEQRQTARQRFKSTARRHRRRHTRHVAAAVADRLARHERTVYREHLAAPRQRCPATAVSATAWENHLRQQFTAAAMDVPAGGQHAGTEAQEQPAGLGVHSLSLPGLFNCAFKRMRVHTAAGLDGMAAPFIKLAQVGEGAETEHLLQGRLRAWFTGMMGRGGMPQAWRPVRIQAIYKKGDPLDPENYRPIAITSVLYRLYASMVTLATSHWADRRQLIPREQFGFQRRRSTVQAAFVLRHAAHARLAEGQRNKLHCVFVDFAKAYDSVPHELLWQHLRERLRMPAGLLAAIMKLYDGAVYELRDGHKRTGQVPCTRGIKQGCPLSPLLFSLYICDLPRTLRNQGPAEGIAIGHSTTAARLQCIMFADDLTLLASSKEGAQHMLDTLHGYATAKGLTVNVGKTEVMVYGEQLARQRIARTPYTYGPSKQPLRRVAEFKFLGLQQAETNSMTPAMTARATAFTASLHAASRTASRLGLGRHLPTRIRMAETYAVPTANYGDVVWGTDQLRPSGGLSNPVQRAVLAHLKQAAGVPASTPAWPLLNELGLQPLQRSWWKHTLRFYNQAVSQGGRQRSPLMYAALAGDMGRAETTPRSWSGQLLAALGELGELEAGAQGGQKGRTALQQAAVALQPISEATVMQLVDAAYQAQQGGDATAADPRDPATGSRATATYNAWFRPTAGTVLKYAQGRTSGSACRRVQANLRLRLGALPTPVTQGARFSVPLGQRTCVACTVRGEGDKLGDVLHTCFECSHVQDQMGDRWGWEGPPDGASDFNQLYSGSLRRAMAYGADIVELVG